MDVIRDGAGAVRKVRSAPRPGVRGVGALLHSLGGRVLRELREGRGGPVASGGLPVPRRPARAEVDGATREYPEDPGGLHKVPGGAAADRSLRPGCAGTVGRAGPRGGSGGDRNRSGLARLFASRCTSSCSGHLGGRLPPEPRPSDPAPELAGVPTPERGRSEGSRRGRGRRRDQPSGLRTRHREPVSGPAGSGLAACSIRSISRVVDLAEGADSRWSLRERRLTV